MLSLLISLTLSAVALGAIATLVVSFARIAPRLTALRTAAATTAGQKVYALSSTGYRVVPHSTVYALPVRYARRRAFPDGLSAAA